MLRRAGHGPLGAAAKGPPGDRIHRDMQCSRRTGSNAARAAAQAGLPATGNKQSKIGLPSAAWRARGPFMATAPRGRLRPHS